MEAAFLAADITIGALSGFVCDVAASLKLGTSLAGAVRSAAQRHPAAVEAFDLAGRDDHAIETQFALSDRLTFPNETLPQIMSFERHGARTSLGLDSLAALDVHSLLAMCGAGRFTVAQIRDAADASVSPLFESLLENGILVAGASSAPLPARMVRPGVTRLQHAGLLYRGNESGVLVDPHFHSSYEPHGLRENLMRSQFEGLVDAILISHSHRDHFDLPTLMTFSPETLIVVPRADRATMMCPDFAATLRALGFTRVVTLDWYDPPLTIGDLQVHAFPFYGEQPLLREAPRHVDLRNHGNTYVVQHDSYTSWFLIDSGNDWTGRMVDVAHAVKERFGTVDILLSNLREFALLKPTYITGAGHYWLALTPDQMRRFSSMRNDVITLGPKGVAEICHIVQAREFLPYAHWWGEAGEPPGPEERLLIEELRSGLNTFGAATKIYPWHIGESYHPGRYNRHG